MSYSREEMANAIANVRAILFGETEDGLCDLDYQLADGLIDQYFTQNRVIETIEELDALETGFVVQSAIGVIWEKDGYSDEDEQDWWICTGNDSRYESTRISLPARILFDPTLEDNYL